MNEENSLQYHAEKYLDWMLKTHHSKRTVEVRRRLLGYFFDWCTKRELHDIQDISRPVMEAYQRYLFYYRTKQGKPLVISSQTKRLTCIKSFFGYLSKNYLVLYNPAAELHLPKQTARLPRQILNVQDVAKIMQMPDLSTPEGLRDRAILETFYSTGIRRMELANLTVYDVDFNRELLFVKEGKGRKDRVIPIGKTALDWLHRYLHEAREKMLVSFDQTALFLNTLGEPISDGYLTELSGRYIKKADIGKMGSCHIFRHTMATLMLENGADARGSRGLTLFCGFKSLEYRCLCFSNDVK